MNNNNIYYASIDKVLSKRNLRFSGNYQEILCALGNICHSETLDKENFSCVAKLYKIDGEILEAEQKMYARFRLVRRLGSMTVQEMCRKCTRLMYLICFQCFLMWYISLEWYLLHVFYSTIDHSVYYADWLRICQLCSKQMTWFVSLIFSAFKMAKTAICFNVFYEPI